MVPQTAPTSDHPSVTQYLAKQEIQSRNCTELNNLTNLIICDDALRILAELPDNSVDLVHTSPPYNISKPYDSILHDRNSASEYLKFLRNAIGQLKRILRPGGSIFWQTGYTKNEDDASDMIPIDLLSYDIFRDEPRPFKLWDRIIWRYWGGHAFKRKFTNKHETILWFVKPGADPVFLVDEVRERAKEYDKRNNFWGRNPGNVWEVDRVAYGSTEQTSHIAVFPEEITERIVRACSVPGSFVLDPFAGSGTVPKVAQSLGRRWLGIEISPVYASEASIRIGFQQPSESESLASELIKHLAFEGRSGILQMGDVEARLREWSNHCSPESLHHEFETDVASVFYDGNGRNLTKRSVWMKYDDLLGTARTPVNPVAIADRLLLNCYKLRQHFNGVTRYKSALNCLTDVICRFTDGSTREYVSRIVTHEPSSYRLSGNRIELITSIRRPLDGAPDTREMKDEAGGVTMQPFQGQMTL